MAGGVESLEHQDRLGRDAGRIAQEIVAHLQGLVCTDTEVTTNAEGFPETVVVLARHRPSAGGTGRLMSDGVS